MGDDIKKTRRNNSLQEYASSVLLGFGWTMLNIRGECHCIKYWRNRNTTLGVVADLLVV
jgi:hypothetical protein